MQKSDSSLNKNSTQRRKRAKQLLIPAGIFLTILLAYAFLHFQLTAAEEQILTGRYKDALSTIEFWQFLPLTSAIDERIGTAHLLLENRKDAANHFQKAKSRTFFAPPDFWPGILKVLAGHARYQDGLFYAEHIEEKIEDNWEILRFYKALFLAGTNQLSQAKREIDSAGTVPDLQHEVSLLREEIERRVATAQYTFLYDRRNLALVSRSLNGNFKIFYDPVKPLLESQNVDFLKLFDDKPGRQITTTLDFRIQTAALHALQKYAGAIVLLDVKTGAILAAAGNPNGPNSAHAPGTSVATDVQYEPGSIIKMITLAGALDNGAKPEQIFPFLCEGILKLRNNQFMYCWKAHGLLPDFDAATAVSCNTSFAKMGLIMGPSVLMSNLRKFGFDSRLPQPFRYNLGKIIPGNMDDLYLANSSIGLDTLTITPLHVAMIAAAIANEGVCMTPNLLLHYRNILGAPYAAPEPVSFGRFMKKETANTLKKAMEQVVLHPEGTGRRAAIPGVSMAMKTGTAGEGAKGYNAIIMGFAPVNQPKVAFAIIAEHSGKAEFEAARITKLFIESIKGYIF